MENNKTLSTKSVFREPNREMYAKLLQIYVLAILIYITIATSDEPPDREAEHDDYGNEGAYDDADYGDANADDDGAEIKNASAQYNAGDYGDAGAYDDAGGDPEDPNAYNDGSGDDKDLEHDDAGQDYGAEGALDDAELNYGDKGEYDDELQKNSNEYTSEDQYENSIEESDSDYELDSEYGMVPLKMPGSTEILNRNTPEPGFDLSYDEMMKLKMWPDAFIPYYIDVFSFNDKVMRDKIRSFLSSVNSLTALNFVELPSPPTNNIRWVFFVNRRGLLGCADHSIRNFTNTGVQQVVLGYHCMSTEGELAEAVLAIAGVPAQHNAPERDYFIQIREENIIPEKKYLFEKRTDDEWLFHDLEYDFNSAGHFHPYKHSINGRATIELKKKIEDVTIGESKVLTANDILKIRMLYNFIAKKKLLQAPDCHKLFEPGNKFSQYKPSEKQKPRPKPFRYTGESPDAPLDQDDIENVSGDKLVNDDRNGTDYDNNADNDLNEKHSDSKNPDDNQVIEIVGPPQYQWPDYGEGGKNPDGQQVIENVGPPQYQWPDNGEGGKNPDGHQVIESVGPPQYQWPDDSVGGEYLDESKDFNEAGNSYENNLPPDDSYNYEAPVVEDNQNTPQEEELDSPGEYYDNKKKPTIVNINKGIKTLAGESYSNRLQLIGKLKPPFAVKAPKKVKNSDLVSVLSDFHTNEEVNPGKYKKQNLKFVRPFG